MEPARRRRIPGWSGWRPRWRREGSRSSRSTFSIPSRGDACRTRTRCSRPRGARRPEPCARAARRRRAGSSSAGSRWEGASPRRWLRPPPRRRMASAIWPASSSWGTRCTRPAGRTSCVRRTCAQVRAPMLFVQGSRDAFGSPAELEPFVAPLASRGTRVFAIEGGDHSLVLPKSSGKDAAQVTARVADEIVRFTGSR